MRSHDGVLGGLIAAHVDDLKACGIESERIAFTKHLEARFGKLKQEQCSFVHVGDA